MTAPIDEAWEAEPMGCVGGTIVVRSRTGRRAYGMDGCPPQRGETAWLAHHAARSTLAASAPLLARALRAICQRFDEQGNDGAESLGQELREQVDDALAAAGVDAPKMAHWRMVDREGPPEAVKVVARGKAGVR